MVSLLGDSLLGNHAHSNCRKELGLGLRSQRSKVIHLLHRMDGGLLPTRCSQLAVNLGEQGTEVTPIQGWCQAYSWREVKLVG